MDRLIAKLLTLHEWQLIGIAFLLICAGGLAAWLALPVRLRLRRVAYLWWLAATALALSASQEVWSLVPAAAEAGLLSPLVLAGMGAFALYGAALYYGSAARAIDVDGTPGRGWLVFVPIANLWLVGAPGRPATDAPRSRLARYAVDPILVVLAVGLLAGDQIRARLHAGSPAYDVTQSAALVALLAEAQTLEESFAAEARLSAGQLPIRLDDVTVLRAIEARGATLRLIHDVDDGVTGFLPGFETLLARDHCAPEMFGIDLARGGRIEVIYRGRGGETVAMFEITDRDCQV